MNPVGPANHGEGLGGEFRVVGLVRTTKSGTAKYERRLPLPCFFTLILLLFVPFTTFKRVNLLSMASAIKSKESVALTK